MAPSSLLCEEIIMVICPVAIAVGCQKCPVFKVCPLKGVIGDQKDAASDAKPTSKPASAKPKKK
jgi:hypothetical protein